MRVKIASSNKNKLNTKKNTLEIGAGTLNQLPYEVVGPDSIYDVIEPMDYLYKDSPYLGSVTNIYNDIEEIPNTKSYDRIISIATLEHIIDLPLVIKESIKRPKMEEYFLVEFQVKVVLVGSIMENKYRT